MLLRVLSYNIHKGFSAGNLSFILERIRNSINLTDADLVFLQEVVGQHDEKKGKLKNWPTTAQFEFLADKMWPHQAYGKNAVHVSGHHGNAVLSKYPIVSWDNINVSTNRLESRGILHVIIQPLDDKPEIHAFCLHFGLFETARRKQVRLLCERIRSSVPEESPLIIAGDFNDWMESSTKTLQGDLNLTEVFHVLHQSHARTFPSWMPLLKLDRIYVRHFQPLMANTLRGGSWRKLSDHLALLAELLLKREPKKESKNVICE